MNISELMAISRECESDDEFVLHPSVRRVYWECMGKTEFVHEDTWATPDGRECTYEASRWLCVKCKEICRDPTTGREIGGTEDADCDILLEWGDQACPAPDFIPEGCLSDAVEALRAKVAAKWDEGDNDVLMAIALQEIYPRVGLTEGVWLHLTARQRFVVFAALLGAVEL